MQILKSITIQEERKHEAFANSSRVNLKVNKQYREANWEGKWEDLSATSIDESTIGITIPIASALLIEIKN